MHLSSVSSLPSQKVLDPKMDAKLEESANDFEAMFMAQMLKPMFDGLETNSMFGGGHGEDAMRGFLVEAYGKSVAEGADLGVADAVKAELVRLQGAQ